MANADERAANGGGGGRGPRLPRWTRQEILVLIEGKRMVEGGGGGRGRGVGRALEPKWAAVSAYCRRHGVDRGPVQCRKRWSNLAGDYKKIKEWKGGEEAFWAMRNDVRREQRLPGFFDREVYDILDGAPPAPPEAAEETERKGTEQRTAAEEEEEEEEAVFDSGRTAADDGLFSDCDDDKEAAAVEEEDGEATEEEEQAMPQAASAVMPISEKKSETVHHQESSEHHPNPGMAKDKHPADNPEKGSPSREGHKRKRRSEEGAGDTNLQSQLIEVLEKNSRVLTSHLEAQNVNYQLDRDQRKDHANSLLGVLGKLADALGRIADKL